MHQLRFTLKGVMFLKGFLIGYLDIDKIIILYGLIGGLYHSGIEQKITY